MWIKIITFFSIKHTHFFSLNSQTLSIYHQNKINFFFSLIFFLLTAAKGTWLTTRKTANSSWNRFAPKKVMSTIPAAQTRSPTSPSSSSCGEDRCSTSLISSCPVFWSTESVELAKYFLNFQRHLKELLSKII